MMTNHRGISLVSITAKVYCRILLNRIRPDIESHLRKEQNGFRPGRSPIQHILALRRVMEGAKHKNLPCVLRFTDFRKAFDHISRDRMFKTLTAYEIPSNIVSAVRVLYINTTATVHTDDGFTDEFRLCKGVLQGDVVAPYLFIVILDYDMRESIQPEDGFTLQRRAGSRQPAQKISDLAFADDIVTLADSKTAAAEVLNRISTSAREVGLIVNEQRTKFINEGANQKVGRRIHKTATKSPERRLPTAYDHRGVISRPSLPERSSQRQTLEVCWQLCSS